MLYLTRKIGESIIINNHIELTVMEVRGKTVKLGFQFPKDATILRKELHQKIREQNLAAAGGSEADFMEMEFNVDMGANPAGAGPVDGPENDKDDVDGNR